MGAADLRERLAVRAAEAGVTISANLGAELIRYYGLLQHWNRTINLTALTGETEAIDRLLLEPVAAARHLPSTPFRLLDIGSGGGSPAIPMKLAAPAAALTMVEARSRKAAFLREAVRVLELRDTAVESARVQEVGTRPDWRNAWDVVTSRGVRVGPAEVELAKTLIRPGGILVLFLSSEEIPAPLTSGIFKTRTIIRLLPGRPSFLAVLASPGE